MTEYEHLLMGDREKALLNKVKDDLRQYNHINFYAINAGEQIDAKLMMIGDYYRQISLLSSRLSLISPLDLETKAFIHDLSTVLISLRSKQDKLARLQTQIPEGMLDVKRALLIVDGYALSDSLDEDAALKRLFIGLKAFMSNANKDYNLIIKQGGAINDILFKTTTLYWLKMRDYKHSLYSLIEHSEECSQLTKAGDLARRCLYNAYRSIPSTSHALELLDKVVKNQIDIDRVISQVGFYSENGRMTCGFLSRLGKPFFHIPHSEKMYHIDYDPTYDIAEAAGNCFGESMMFIHALSNGRFKRLCPEAGIINFQLEQTRRLSFQKVFIGEGETDVSAESRHQSLQWEDAKKVLIDNPHFNSGDICGISLAMNEYTQAQKSFTTGHIAVLAKLDVTQSQYKYIIFEKELGVFGLVDDESLEYIFSQQIMAIYQEMNYSKIKLNKYGEATSATYQLIRKIKPMTESVAQMQMEHALGKSKGHSFFEFVEPLPSCSSAGPSTEPLFFV